MSRFYRRGNMKTYNRILVPIDGSKLSDKAFKHALRLARLMDAEITVIHVIDSKLQLSAPFESTEMSTAMRLVEEECESIAHSLLEEYTGRSRDGGIEITTLLLRGNVANEIIGVSGDFDLVVMGTVGQGTLTSLLLGSVAEKVARHAECPVMLVRKRRKK